MNKITFSKTCASLLTAIFLLCGCASNGLNRGHGDVGQFILEHSTLPGVSVRANKLPPLGNQWNYYKDQNGVIIRMATDQCEKVQAFLNLAFGRPATGPIIIPNGGTLSEYRFSPNGGIQFVCDRDFIQIVVARPNNGKK